MLVILRRLFGGHQVNTLARKYDLKLVVKTTTGSFYDSAYIGVDKFLKIRLASEKNNHDKFDEIRQRFRDQLNNTSTNTKSLEFDIDDFQKLIHLANNDQDVELIENILKKQTWSDDTKSVFKNLYLDEQTQRLLYVLNKPQTAIELIEDQNSKVLFRRPNNLLIVMNKLASERKYDQLIEFFLNQLGDYEAANATDGRDKHPNDQLIPANHVSLVIEALYFSKNADSLEVLKKLFEFFESKSINLSNQSLGLSCLLALKKGDIKYAEKILKRPSLTEKSKKLHLNLQVLLKLREKNLKECLQLLRRLPLRGSYGLRGTFFISTIKAIRNEIGKKNDLKEEFGREFDRLVERLEKYEQIIDLNLVDYLYLPKTLRKQV